MDREQFTEFATEMIRYIINYKENIRERKVLSSVEPGYLRPLIPEEAPLTPDKWQDIMADIERVIMPGISHWHSPRFHAYYPTANSYPSIVADMLSDGIGCIGFSWISSPAITELEVAMIDWLGKMLGLPKEFLSFTGGTGGGCIMGSASEATLMTLLGAKARTIRKMKALHPEWSDLDVISKLVAYTSELAHCGVERAGLLGDILMRMLPVNERFELTAETLQEAIIKDKEAGLIPFYVAATLGTTSICSFDPLDKIGPVCQREGLWLHVDAAYAGSAFICPEFRKFMKGIEYVDSFSTNPNKWMLVTFDCSTMWLKDPSDLINKFRVNRVILQHKHEGSVPDFRHWQIPMGRRFRSLKLWFVMRLYGVENLQAYIRKHVKLAHEFESYVNEDPRFEIIGEVTMGLVCFRLRKSNEINEKLLGRINDNGKIFLVPSSCHGIFFLRFSVSSRIIESDDIKYSWEEIKNAAAEVLLEHEN